MLLQRPSPGRSQDSAGKKQAGILREREPALGLLASVSGTSRKKSNKDCLSAVSDQGDAVRKAGLNVKFFHRSLPGEGHGGLLRVNELSAIRSRNRKKTKTQTHAEIMI